MMMRRTLLVLGAVVALVLTGVAAFSLAANNSASCTQSPVITETDTTQSFTVECSVPKPAPVTETVTVPGPTQTVTVTATPSPSSTPTPSPTPTVTPTPTAAPTTEAPAPSTFPNASNTGVPAGTVLTAYTGSCSITAANTGINAKTVNCPNGLMVRAANVTIRNSKVNGRIIVDTDVNRTWSLTLTDSEVDASSGDLPAIYNGNVTIVRANIHGGHNGLECQEHSSVCSLRDSWIHDQWQAPTGDTHLGGILHLGEQVPCAGTNGLCAEFVHNTIVCDAPVNSSGGGCTGDINLLPHYGPLPGVLVQGNYLGANVGSSFCTYGGAGMEYAASNVVYRDNVFQRGTNKKCAAYGPVTNFDRSAAGNAWSNNTYDDGSVVAPAN